MTGIAAISRERIKATAKILRNLLHFTFYLRLLKSELSENYYKQ
jgi:hypothetical protein